MGTAYPKLDICGIQQLTASPSSDQRPVRGGSHWRRHGQLCVDLCRAMVLEGEKVRPQGEGGDVQGPRAAAQRRGTPGRKKRPNTSER
jgi:hypothetical protein